VSAQHTGQKNHRQRTVRSENYLALGREVTRLRYERIHPTQKKPRDDAEVKEDAKDAAVNKTVEGN